MGKIIGLCLLMIISSVSYSAENSTPQKDDNSQLDLISEEIQTSYIDDNLNNTSARITLPDNVNIINYSLAKKRLGYEIFDENHYTQKAETISIDTTLKEDGHLLDSNQYELAAANTRTQITNAKSSKYLPTAKMIMTFKNVYNKKKKSYVTLRYSGTGFLEGKNIAVTAGHCCYCDVTDSGDYQDNISNPGFPDSIEFYFGCDNATDINQESSYKYYAEAKVINIEYSYYDHPTTQHDWGAILLDRNIGYSTGWYGKIGNWASECNNQPVYSWGYPADKPYGTLWKTSGTLVDSLKYKYNYNLETYNGQSGSPIFMEDSSGNSYVCGIHTRGETNFNSGTKITNFIFHYLNSFVTTDLRDYTYEALDLSIKAKVGLDWSINITNNSSHIREVTYNTKMCFYSDAQNWSNLKDTKIISLKPYQTKNVMIYSNWFATSITACYYYNGHQVITYADNLNGNKTLSQHTNIK